MCVYVHHWGFGSLSLLRVWCSFHCSKPNHLCLQWLECSPHTHTHTHTHTHSTSTPPIHWPSPKWWCPYQQMKDVSYQLPCRPSYLYISPVSYLALCTAIGRKLVFNWAQSHIRHPQWDTSGQKSLLLPFNAPLLVIEHFSPLTVLLFRHSQSRLTGAVGWSHAAQWATGTTGSSV